METLFRHLQCTNVKILGQPSTQIEAFVVGKSESITCIAGFFTLPDNCEIGFDSKKVSHVLYVYPKSGQSFKLKLRHVEYASFPILETIELV